MRNFTVYGSTFISDNINLFYILRNVSLIGQQFLSDWEDFYVSICDTLLKQKKSDWTVATPPAIVDVVIK